MNNNINTSTNNTGHNHVPTKVAIARDRINEIYRKELEKEIEYIKSDYSKGLTSKEVVIEKM